MATRSGRKGRLRDAQARRRVVSTPVQLRALAHPIRLDLLERLSTDGPLTASEAGRLIGETSGSTSFHLRQLARYGFVEPADGGTGREKPWQLVGRGITWTDQDGVLVGEDTEALAEAGAGVASLLLQRATEDAAAWTARQATEPRPWRGAGEVLNTVRNLTAGQLRQLVDALVDIIGDDRPEPGPGTRRVRIALVAVPTSEPDGG